MKILVFGLVFALTIAAISAAALGAYDPEEDAGEALTAQDILDFYEMENLNHLSKRGKKQKAGPCYMPNGTYCKVCNLKIKDPNRMDRYVACTTGSDPLQ